MTVSSGFFNSVNHDRLYNAEQLSSIFDGIIIDGVYENYGKAFNVIAYEDANSTVIVDTGRAWFDHTWTLNDSQFSIKLDPPNEMLDRLDAIVIDVNLETATRANSIVYLKGSEATPEIPPEFINTEFHKQHPICYITRHAGPDAPVKQEDIQYLVGTSVCPMVTGILESQNLENIILQLKSEFNTWWDGIKETLDENVATNLQNQINEIKEQLNGESALVGLMTKPVYELYKSGDYKLKITSTKLTPKVTGGETYFSQPYPMEFFLPDGKTCGVFGCDFNGTHAGVFVTIFNKNGVGTSTKFNEYGSNGEGNVNHCLYMGGNVDSYPVKIYVLMTPNTADTYSRHAYWVNLYTITITSSGTVSFTDQQFSVACNVDGVTSQKNIHACPTVNGSRLFAAILSSQNTADPNNSGNPAEFVFLGKMTKDGVFTYKKSTQLNQFLYVGSMNGATDKKANRITYGQNGSWILRSVTNSGSNKYTIIDEEDLNAQIYSGDPDPNTYYLKDYRVEYGFSLYSLSEKNGLQAKQAVVGGVPEGTISKISPYFIAGSNSGESIPEGSYMAFKDSETYVGSGPNGEPIAIGSNGGAAILKNKYSVTATLNFSKIPSWLPGSLESGGSQKYLVCGDLMRAPGDDSKWTESVNKGVGNISTATVVTIEREA